MQFLAAIEQHVSSTRDDIDQECTPDTYPHRIIFMGMVVDKAPQVRRGTSSERPEAPDLECSLRLLSLFPWTEFVRQCEVWEEPCPSSALKKSG